MMPNPYGYVAINLDTQETARRPVAEASKRKGFKMAVAVTDTNGDLVYFEKMDSTQIASVPVRFQKAASARSTSARQEAPGRSGREA